MRRSVLAAFAVVTACQSSIESEGPAAVAQAVVQPELQLSVPPTGPGSFSQGNAVIAQGPDRWLVVWADDRANGLRGSDIYGARVLFDGGVLDPTGFPSATRPRTRAGPRSRIRTEPSPWRGATRATWAPTATRSSPRR